MTGRFHLAILLSCLKFFVRVNKFPMPTQFSKSSPYVQHHDEACFGSAWLTTESRPLAVRPNLQRPRQITDLTVPKLSSSRTLTLRSKFWQIAQASELAQITGALPALTPHAPECLVKRRKSKRLMEKNSEDVLRFITNSCYLDYLIPRGSWPKLDGAYTVKCQYCGGNLPAGATDCPNCGEEPPPAPPKIKSDMEVVFRSIRRRHENES